MLRTSLIVASLALAGCGFITYPDALPATLQEIDAIRNDSDLAADEKRAALAALGIDETTINGILSRERTGNQFGGTLTTAFEKVTGDSFSTLTPDEVQIYGDATGSATFADADATAIVALFVARNINTADELEAYLDNPGIEVDPAIGDGDLRGVFIGTDPDSLIDLLP